MIHLKHCLKVRWRWALPLLLWLFCFWPVLLSCEGVEDRAEGKAKVEGDEPAVPTTSSGQATADIVAVDTVVYSPVPAHVDTALSFFGMRDAGTNNTPVVNRFLHAVGLGPGNPWCASMVSYCLDVAVWRKRVMSSESGVVSRKAHSPNPPSKGDLWTVGLPVVRSGLATNLITKRSVKASNVVMGLATVPDGAVVIWRKGNGIYGHAGLVIHWDKSSGQTVEGNTSRPAVGLESVVDGVTYKVIPGGVGEGVYIKRRTIQPGNYFRIVAFTPVVYEIKG